MVFNVCHHLRGAWQAESLLDYAILLLAQESYSSRSWNHVASCPFGMASVTGLTTKIADLGVSRLSKQNVWLLTWALQEKKHEKQIQDRNHMHHLLGTSLTKEHCIWNCCGIDGITTRVVLQSQTLHMGMEKETCLLKSDCNVQLPTFSSAASLCTIFTFYLGMFQQKRLG